MPTQNLVQIQRDLQSLPPGAQTMMYLKRAKDGMVASVPPYLAAAELSSREKMAQREALASGAAPGEQPTVSQQLSQKADLLALQAMKKQALDRQAADQARTAQMPAPEGAPEPQEQPKPEGGLASLPVQFGFEGGGIVAFTDGGPADKKKKKPSIYDLSRDPWWKTQRGDVDMSALPQNLLEGAGVDYSSPEAQIAAQRAGSALATPGAAMLDVATLPYNAIKNVVSHGGASLTPFYDQISERGDKAAQAEMQARIAAAYGPNAPRMPQVQTPSQGPAAAASAAPSAPPGPPQQRPPAAPGAQAAAPQQPAAPSPQQALETDIMRQLGMAPGAQGLPAAAAPAGPTIAKTGADIMEAAKLFGLDKPAGEEERRMIAEMQARHAQQQRERARMGLKAVLGGFSQGYGGAAAADVAASQRAYTEDMAQQKAMYDMVNAINKGNRGEAEKKFERLMSLQGEREKETGAMSRAELQAKVNMYDSMRRSGDSRYSTDKHFEAAMAQAREAAARGDRAEKAQSDANLRSLVNSLVPEANRLLSEYNKAVRPADRADYKRQYDTIAKQLEEARAQLAKLGGVEMPSRAAAPAPAPANRPPLTSFQR